MAGVNISDSPVHRGFTGTKTVDFKVSLDAPSDVAITAKVAAREWARVASTNRFAVAGTDFDPATFDLTFEPGETEKTITVTVHGFETDEPTKRGPKEFEIALLETSATPGKKPIGVCAILYGDRAD